jgi:3-methyladenine DNA glycosylase/8-oxoguanine DNA glycosylase
VTARPGIWRGANLYTIGHSTRSLDELVSLLRAFGVSALADVRAIPRSRHNPQFDARTLPSALRQRGIRYVHLAELGGLRRARANSPNAGWRNANFRGFADYMSTEEFESGLAKLHALAAEGTVAVMCAEAVPWRCHRSLIADALVARGAQVEHIATAQRATPHRMTPFAHVDGIRISYPGEPSNGHLAASAPFHLEATVRVLQRRPSNPVEVWEGGRYLRLFSIADDLVLVELANHGDVDRPDLVFRLVRGHVSPEALAALEGTLRKVLGLDVNPRPLQQLVRRERRLSSVAVALRGMRPPRFDSLFEAFFNVVPFQQVSLDSGVAIVRRLVERFGASLEHEGQLRHAYPEAHVIGSTRLDSLKACGLSLRKADALRGIARAIASGGVAEGELASLRSDDAIRRLVELPGIGPWSASLVLLRGLGRLDVFPPGDAGVARGLRTQFGIEPGPSFERIVHRFGDQRGYLYFCALGGALLGKGLIHPARSKRA